MTVENAGTRRSRRNS